ncbi:helix-turn-helix transcriptional regulator [Embleya scabrispora]|uniref:helix-turn-helix transcriptional regulator n=1 Tax=Embleya scabrispora TaxID=159449 RepID=UPI00059518AF|nr:helix-turn-helix transcriptional regulator [Embleya scabrispora]MYS82802.1 helix-turn-helix domain-containing protein [Streptomyces sp. SID5474]
MASEDSDLGGFLRSRRARVNPTSFGGASGIGRRVPGLRREEVAALAGISVEYYARLERGRKVRVSETVLGAIARALELNDLEARHLHDLAHSMEKIPMDAGARDHHGDAIRPELQVITDALSPMPAWISNYRMDFLAGNREARAIYAPLFTNPEDRGNRARFIFLNPAGRAFECRWERVADETVGALRWYATRHPDDRELAKLILDLNSRSTEFRSRWSDHDIVHNRSGDVHVNHPTIGDLKLPYERLDVTHDPGLSLFIHVVEPGSPLERRLAALVADGFSAPPRV